jgi:hypothetical protein
VKEKKTFEIYPYFWVTKETLTETLEGPKTGIEIENLSDPIFWPRKGGGYVQLSTGLPTFAWRDYDRPAGNEHNAYSNWCPRICFVYKPAFDGQPMQFAHICWDGVRLPWLLRNSTYMALLTVLALALLFGFSIYYSNGRSYIPSSEGLLFTSMVLGVVIGAAMFMKVFIPLRTLLLFDFFVHRGIFSGAIKPKIHCVPWEDLDGFEIVKEQPIHVPMEQSQLFTVNRSKIVAHFGLRHKPFVVAHTTGSELHVKEISRRLQLHFIANRKKYQGMHEQWWHDLREIRPTSEEADSFIEEATKRLDVYAARPLSPQMKEAHKALRRANEFIINVYSSGRPDGESFEQTVARCMEAGANDHKSCEQLYADAHELIAPCHTILDDPAIPRDADHIALCEIKEIVEKGLALNDSVRRFRKERETSTEACWFPV